jgi:hypothetical protein
MVPLEEAERRGKFRYIIYALAPDLWENDRQEEVELFFRALAAQRMGKKYAGIPGLLGRHLLACLARNPLAVGRCWIQWLCLFPSSRFLVRRLFHFCKKNPLWQIHRFAIGKYLGYGVLALSDRRQLCRDLLQSGRDRDAIEAAKSWLGERPQDGEARQLLWTALLRLEPSRGTEEQ